jgi:uncharacterized protein (DUF2252 family)
VRVALAEATELGRQARSEAPRSAHGEWAPAVNRLDAVETLEGQAQSRVPWLLPIRYGRMLDSPFAFFRGGAAIMAADLADTPASGLRVQLCGDAHLSNFGGFAAPDRDLVFDLNDFDETLPGPWEWDVKRLAASVAVAGRELGFDERERRESVLATVRDYRLAMRRFATMRTIDVWYARLQVDDLFRRWTKRASGSQRKGLEKAIAKGRAKDSLRAFAKLTHDVDGQPRIISDPPLIVPLNELVQEADREQVELVLRGVLRDYRRTLEGHRRHLLDSYEAVHMAHKVVGVGSVGTRAWIVLMLGNDATDPLFMQIKQASESVLEPFAGASRFRTHGQRVVEGQRLMQAASDVLLGWLRVDAGPDGQPQDYYVRQLWDQKASVAIENLTAGQLAEYGKVCGWTLARAHARSGDRVAIAAYLGAGDRFERAVADFSELYADQNERDYAALAAAVKAGTIVAETGS